MKGSIEKLRLEYGNMPLREGNLHPNPLEQFTCWLDEALEANVIEPNGMTLATVTATGHPTSRTVLLKGISKGAFLFYTHYGSRKGEHLATNPAAALTFWWKEIHRQVNIEGRVEKVSRRASIAYFKTRPRGAQLAAYASHQSEPLATRAEIDLTYKRLKEKYKGREIPCPSGWGGYRVAPERFEFWQGRRNRLHDRFLYVKVDGEWVLSRLSP